MHTGLCLDVAEFVRSIVRELQMAECPALVGLVETLELALEKVATLRRDDERWPAGARCVELRRRPDDWQPLLTCERMELPEGTLAELVELARLRIAAGPQAAVAELDDW